MASHPDDSLPDHHIVRADEVDQTGTDISTVPDDQLMPGLVQEFEAEKSRRSEDDGLPELPQRLARQPHRPELRRDGAAPPPPPPLQPPPPAPIQQTPEQPTDSLSLAQLRRLVQDMPKMEQRAYAFEYADSQPFPEELDEWFQYNEPDRFMLLGSKASFEQCWYCFASGDSPIQTETVVSWIDADESLRKSFLEQTIRELGDDHLFTSIEALENICYVLVGVWGVTGGRTAEDHPQEPLDREAAQTPKNMSLQFQWMEKNVLLFQQCGGIPALFAYVKRVLSGDQSRTGVDLKDFEDENGAAAYSATKDREINLLLTALYLVIELARRLESSAYPNHDLKDGITSLQPNLLVLLTEVIARLRWDDASSLPVTRILLVFWKSILLLFGGSVSLRRAKEALEPDSKPVDESGRSSMAPVLKASPLDYHIFRQEVTSKYPAYNPPPPLVPLDLDMGHNSILPPLSNHSSRYSSSTALFHGAGPAAASGNTSIFHQPVHIATPAPSPPPSPVGPNGKATKKQNYQTNQHFPFMYPPLDQDSNDIGGKGSSGQQDTLVGKKWEGSDVPASIIEAGKLFASRTKMTRAIRQLWEERERFLKYDRGWDANDASPEAFDYQDEDGDDAMPGSSKIPKAAENKNPVKECDDEDVQQRLDAVEQFYAQAMPNLQSLVIVLLKEILTNITAIASQANGDAMNGPNRSMVNTSDDTSPEADMTIEELDSARHREIKAKAISGALLLLLKWFKRSHILKFEYMTQLLLDSNYLPLILKMFIHQEVDKAVSQKNDRDDQNFSTFCRLQCDQPVEEEKVPEPEPEPEHKEPESEDEAVPPPILRHSHSQILALNQTTASPEKELDQSHGSLLPEVDELGFPTAPLPEAPITTYSFRNFFSVINLLHVMQKITRNKAHRCLLLVQYKSSAILRKGIKIPDPHLRLYTLKLFKSQVPYCGRKWRQTHMRIITAIYLYCRPELRDDWLAGSAVDAEVEEALPMEQALRGLTHWWHLRRYKNSMAIEEQSIMEEERDYFTRELEAMGVGFANDGYSANDEQMAGNEVEGQMPFEGW